MKRRLSSRERLLSASLKEEVGGKVCLWGGVNSAVTLGLWSPERVEDATVKAIRTLAPGGGFILSAIDQVFEDTPWQGLMAMVSAWKRIAGYAS